MPRSISGQQPNCHAELFCAVNVLSETITPDPRGRWCPRDTPSPICNIGVFLGIPCPSRQPKFVPSSQPVPIMPCAAADWVQMYVAEI